MAYVKTRGLQRQAGVAAALVALMLAGCSFGSKDAAPTDPNAYPANYRKQIVEFLRQSLSNRADFRGALISAPMLVPVGANPRYVVCVQLHGSGVIKNKVAIYFAAELAQFVDSTPEECGSAAYTPFTELAAAMPSA